ncbi:MAG: hypothetical protein AAGD00_01695 [Planctomycetota bacterium]
MRGVLSDEQALAELRRFLDVVASPTGDRIDRFESLRRALISLIAIGASEGREEAYPDDSEPSPDRYRHWSTVVADMWPELPRVHHVVWPLQRLDSEPELMAGSTSDHIADICREVEESLGVAEQTGTAAGVEQFRWAYRHHLSMGHTGWLLLALDHTIGGFE